MNELKQDMGAIYHEIKIVIDGLESSKDNGDVFPTFTDRLNNCLELLNKYRE